MKFVYGLLTLISTGSAIIFGTKASGKSLSFLKKKETWKFIGKKVVQIGELINTIFKITKFK